ncbi:MAG TPA: TolC family protein [Sphingobium sp.]|nr:TolC family protein [Sphingobium sp.]
MVRFFAALLAATACAAVAQAQDRASPGAERLFTLDDAVAAAGGRAPLVEAAQAAVAASRAARTVAGLRPNPSIETDIENFAGTGPYRRFDETETTISLSVPIELGGKRAARIAAADARTDRALLLTALTQADVRWQVTQLYIAAVAARQRLATAQDQGRIATQTADAARARVQAGRASPIEAQRADVARINAEAGAERAARLLTAARANLARRIGQPLTGALDVGWLERLPAPHGPPEPVQVEGMLALAAADADLAVADAGIRLARAQRVPDITVGPGVRRFEATNATAAVVSLSVPLPLFNGGRASVDEARAERRRADAARRATALDIAQAITDAQVAAANAATSARAANGPALAAAREAARIARIGYREGKFGQLDLLDAERTLAETRLAAIDALVDYRTAQAELERLTAPAPQQEN